MGSRIVSGNDAVESRVSGCARATELGRYEAPPQCRLSHQAGPTRRLEKCSIGCIRQPVSVACDSIAACLILHSTQDDIARMDSLSEQIGCVQTLRGAFDPILNVIIQALDSPAVFVRTKALRALSQILTSDSELLSYVRQLHFVFTTYLCFAT